MERTGTENKEITNMSEDNGFPHVDSSNCAHCCQICQLPHFERPVLLISNTSVSCPPFASFKRCKLLAKLTGSHLAKSNWAHYVQFRRFATACLLRLCKLPANLPMSSRLAQILKITYKSVSFPRPADSNCANFTQICQIPHSDNSNFANYQRHC